MKNSGTTTIKGIQAYVLIDDAISTGGYNCGIGSDKALISTKTTELEQN